MSESTPYIPYEATAKVIARHDETIDEFLCSLFDHIDERQKDIMIHFIAGKIHDGIEMGLALQSADTDPMSPIEAYRFGYEEGKIDGELNR